MKVVKSPFAQVSTRAMVAKPAPVVGPATPACINVLDLSNVSSGIDLLATPPWAGPVVVHNPDNTFSLFVYVRSEPEDGSEIAITVGRYTVHLGDSISDYGLTFDSVKVLSVLDNVLAQDFYQEAITATSLQPSYVPLGDGTLVAFYSTGSDIIVQCYEYDSDYSTVIATDPVTFSLPATGSIYDILPVATTLSIIDSRDYSDDSLTYKVASANLNDGTASSFIELFSSPFELGTEPVVALVVTAQPLDGVYYGVAGVQTVDLHGNSTSTANCLLMIEADNITSYPLSTPSGSGTAILPAFANNLSFGGNVQSTGIVIDKVEGTAGGDDFLMSGTITASSDDVYSFFISGAELLFSGYNTDDSAADVITWNRGEGISEPDVFDTRSVFQTDLTGHSVFFNFTSDGITKIDAQHMLTGDFKIDKVTYPTAVQYYEPSGPGGANVSTFQGDDSVVVEAFFPDLVSCTNAFSLPNSEGEQEDVGFLATCTTANYSGQVPQGLYVWAGSTTAASSGSSSSTTTRGQGSVVAATTGTRTSIKKASGRRLTVTPVATHG